MADKIGFIGVGTMASRCANLARKSLQVRRADRRRAAETAAAPAEDRFARRDAEAAGRFPPGGKEVEQVCLVGGSPPKSRWAGR
jgi:3-hydroxyacyl-CoA dehydrogenase